MNDLYELHKKISPRYRLVLALFLFAIALFFRFEFVSQSSGGAFVTFYPAIILSFYFCGLLPGAIVALLSGLAGAYYFIPPYQQLTLNFQIPNAFIFFTITASLIGVLIASLHNRIEQLNVILDNEMIGGMMLNHRKIIWCNRAMSAILGYRRDALIGSTTEKLFADSTMFEEVGREAYPLKKGGTYRKQFEMRRADGAKVWVDVSGALLSYNESMSLWLVNDITKLKMLELDLKHQVNYDYLTGLSSKSAFMLKAESELNRAIRYASAWSLMIIDIDFFKKVNDTHGHQVGDLVLKHFADLCLKTLREFDICGRIGGEEFAALLPQTNQAEALLAAERLRRAIEDDRLMLTSTNTTLQFTISIGIASLSSAHDNMQVLMHQADQALYVAKNTGRNRVYHAAQGLNQNATQQA